MKPVLLSLLLLPGSLVVADVLSVNFHNGAAPNQISEKTGLVPDADWQNFAQAEEGDHAVEGKGRVVWRVREFSRGKSPLFGIKTGYPERLFRSQLRTTSFEGGSLKIRVEDLPADWRAKGVDVIVYWHAPVEIRKQPHVQPFTVNGRTLWLVSHGDQPVTGQFAVGTLTDQAAALKEDKSLNTLIFRNVKSFPVVIETRRDAGMGGKGGGSNGGIAGFQIVPSSTQIPTLP